MAGNRRDEIVRTAAQLFSRQGYHATSMRHIAEGVGIQVGSLYRHIDAKEDLLMELVDAVADEFIAGLEPLVGPGAPGSARERLTRAMASHLAVMSSHLPDATVFFHEWRHLSAARRSTIQRKRDMYESYFRSIITDGIKAGEFRPIDDRLTGIAVLSLVNWFYQWYSPDGSMAPEEIAEVFADFMLEGISIPGPGAAGGPSINAAARTAEIPTEEGARHG